MKLPKNIFSKFFLLPFIGLIFTIAAIFTPVDVFADPTPDDNTSTQEEKTNPEDKEEKSEDKKEDKKDKEKDEEEETNNCYDQVGAISWLVCPTTGTIAKAVDSIYNILSDLLVVKPIITDNGSPIYLVWQYMKDISNIVFIIMFLIVIYSQVTGFGINNYGIKKTLPRIIVAAILVNLSYIICALAVDISNILGVSLRGVFTSIEEATVANGGIVETAKIGWTELTLAIVGGGTIAGFAIGAMGGISQLFWMLVPALFGAIMAVIAGLVTVAARQALVSLLVMISPLAFVAYLLPNTTTWFEKWKKLLIQMLVFFPTFSIMFGASQLAGWAMITSSDSVIILILGLIVQVYPLFFAFKLLQMSGTVLGKVSSAVNKLGSAPGRTIGAWAAGRRNVARAEHDEKYLKQRRVNPLSGSSVRAAMQYRNEALQDRLRIANQNSAHLKLEHLDAAKMGQRIIGYTRDGRPIFRTPTANTGSQVINNIINNHNHKAMEREYESREHALRHTASKMRMDNAMNAIGTHLETNGMTNAKLTRMSGYQAQNFLEYKTQASAARRNNASDERFYFEQVRNAAKAGENSQAYQNLITRGAGSDAYSTDQIVKNNALISVTADAYDAFERERASTTSKYSTYFDKQITADVIEQYKKALSTKNIDSIVASQNVLARRGDFDVIGRNLQAFMDRTGDFADIDTDQDIRDIDMIGSDFMNTLAMNLMGMKDKDGTLGRLGKHINMETWRFSQNDRSADHITMKEYVTGYDSDGQATKKNIVSLLEGTDISKMERTALDDLLNILEAYSGADFPGGQAEAEAQKKAVRSKLLPQLVSAIPKYTSGSEQIRSAVKFIVNGKYNDETNSWQISGQDSGAMDYTIKYLNSLTPANLVSMKSDVFQGVMARLEVETGSRVAAEQKFRDVFGANGNGNIQKLQASDPSTLAPMKKAIRDVLQI